VCLWATVSYRPSPVSPFRQKLDTKWPFLRCWGGIENEAESIPRTRGSHPPGLKAKVAVGAIKAHKTAAQIAQMFGVHLTQVGG
jgi:hypothetical protein